jgi:shikimate kinase
MEQGEPYFRQKEWEYLQYLNREFRGIVALGGGALHNQQVIDHLKATGLLIFIDTPMDEIVKRVHRNTRRPILYDEEGKIKSKETLFTELKALYLQREAFYKQAQIIIKTASYSSIEEKADAAIEQIIRHV